MRKKQKLLVPLFVILIFFSAIHISSQAYIGVKVGYWAKYRDTCVWSSENPEATEPDYLKEIKNTESRTVTVKAIRGTTVTISVTSYFKNDTQKTGIYSADIATGKGDDEFQYQVVLAYLGEGDRIGQSALLINSTTSKKFAGMYREVNYAGIRIEIEGVTVFEYYWDEKTGILCASLTFDTVFSEGYKTTTWIETDLIETNIWHAESEPQPTIIEWWQPVIVVIAISAAYILIRRKRRSKKPK